jgi:hypothetical protein
MNSVIVTFIEPEKALQGIGLFDVGANAKSDPKTNAD